MNNILIIKVNNNNYFINKEEWNKQRAFRIKCENTFPRKVKI